MNIKNSTILNIMYILSCQLRKKGVIFRLQNTYPNPPEAISIAMALLLGQI